MSIRPHYKDPIEYDYDEARREIEQVALQAVLESEGECSEEDACHDTAVNYLLQMNLKTRHLVARCYLGWDPEGDADLYKEHEVPVKEPDDE